MKKIISSIVLVLGFVLSVQAQSNAANNCGQYAYIGPQYSFCSNPITPMQKCLCTCVCADNGACASNCVIGNLFADASEIEKEKLNKRLESYSQKELMAFTSKELYAIMEEIDNQQTNVVLSSKE